MMIDWERADWERVDLSSIVSTLVLVFFMDSSVKMKNMLMSVMCWLLVIHVIRIYYRHKEKMSKSIHYLTDYTVSLLKQDNHECSICLELIDKHHLFVENKLVVTVCGHSYHNSCLSQWLTHSSTCPKCPVCRYALV